MLWIIDRTLESAEENLTFDDRLLDAGQETLRFWESPVPFVVLGRSGNAEEQVNIPACRAAGVPILRRSSGGGAVLQGPGCLNYALILSLDLRPELTSIPDSYRILLSRVADALRVPALEVRGSDILLEGRKISGNAQRRTRGWVLHHGTILHGLCIDAIERCLLEPARRPAHRGGRTHRQFVTSLRITGTEIKARMLTGVPRLTVPSSNRACGVPASGSPPENLGPTW